jgi:hypothetical protein
MHREFVMFALVRSSIEALFDRVFTRSLRGRGKRRSVSATWLGEPGA